jgi:predicted SAM-dependent methyltransferase
MPVVSVIMPSYNHAPFIGRAIGSVLSQTLEDIELIVIDDGSTDGSADVIRSFSDQRIRMVLRERNVGSAEGTNEGLRLARSPFVAMISSDDFFETHKLETQLRVFQEPAAVTAVFCRPRIVDEAGREYAAGTHRLQQEFSAGRWRRPELLRRLFLLGNFLCHPSVMVRRETYDRVGLHDTRMSSLGDFDMWVRMALGCEGDFVVLDEPLMSFRAHAGNTSGLTLANLQCGENEWPLIADRLRSLRDRPDVFAEAFPEMAGVPLGTPADVEYALGRLAIKHRVRSVRAYGLHRLYDLMADGVVAARLATTHGFTTRDLIKLSQETDTTGVAANSSEANSSEQASRRPHFLQRVARETRRVALQVQALAATAGDAVRRAETRVHWKPGYTQISREPMNGREAAAVTLRYLEERSTSRGQCGVNLGCGDHPFNGWLNVDLGGQPNLFWDLTRPFEWAPAGAFDLCYSEHVLEHFSRPVGIAILREAFRSLRPGGIVRIAVPDLANVVRMYADETFLDVPHAARDVLEPTAVEATALFGSSYGTKGERLNVGMYGWGHAYLYDEEDLTRVFAEAGFTDMRRCRHSESSHPGLRSLETRPQFQSALIVEGTKA